MWCKFGHVTLEIRGNETLDLHPVEKNGSVEINGPLASEEGTIQKNEDVYLKAKARIRPRLSYMCRVRSTTGYGCPSGIAGTRPRHECGTCQTVKARFWLWLSDESP